MLFNQIDYHYKQKKMEVLELNECFELSDFNFCRYKSIYL